MWERLDGAGPRVEVPRILETVSFGRWYWVKAYDSQKSAQAGATLRGAEGCTQG
jgi:hypothetical protein